MSEIKNSPLSIKKVLIANRGEIACRVMKTARTMGVKTVAVYSDADYQALHRQMADEAFHIGPSPATESYLCIDKIINAAKTSGADAIHPGYGFLSENAEFAKACASEGITFIGPPVAAIESMGSKSEAKSLMEKAGVPMLPGYHGEDQSDETLLSEAEKIGYPLMVKAALGGGGKGMRVVEQSADLLEGLASAKRESLSSFGDAQLLLESFITTPRHVEVQIFFDNHGEGVYLFDRDCSLQRRHQKVIEEAPAPNLSDDLRSAMGKAAVEAGKAINYTGAGTVEFLLDGDRFYFMEMNTRLQVEHPVTEAITGVDLVEWQLRIASDQKLPRSQHQLSQNGHALEARIYAEKPEQDFLPSSGRIFHLQWPEVDDGVRVDTGIQQGDYISSHYDPMLAKLVVWAENRSAAIEKLYRALADYQQVGLSDNRDFLSELVQQDDFKQEKLSTRFIDDHPASELDDAQMRAALVTAALHRYQQQAYSGPDSSSALPFQLSIDHESNSYDIAATRDKDHFTVSLPDGFCTANAYWYETEPGVFTGSLHLENRILNCSLVPMPGQKLKLFFSDFSIELGLPGHQSAADTAGGDNMTAPMNGTVSTVLIAPGEKVTEGSALLILEAMKMEHTITAPRDGFIESVFFKAGDRVEAGSSLMAYRDETEDAA